MVRCTKCGQIKKKSGEHSCPTVAYKRGWKYISCPKCGRIPKKNGEHICPTTSWNKGIPITEKQREQLRVWHTGRKLSPEHAKLVTKNLEPTWEKHRLPEGTIVNSHGGY